MKYETPKLTKEDVKRLLEEGQELAKEMKKRLDKLSLTSEDWAFRVR